MHDLKGQSNLSLNTYNSWTIHQLYKQDSIVFTTWKPILYIDTAAQHFEGSWAKRKLFHEHLLILQKPGFNIYGDIISDTYIGSSNRTIPTSNGKRSSKNPSMNSRGYRIFGNAGTKLWFETEFYENQGKFPAYVDSIIRRNRSVPGQPLYKNVGDAQGIDYNYSTARLVYMPNEHFLFDLGYGKNFIGDGYRSLMLSDWAFNYPYLRISATWNKLRYSLMFSQYVSEVPRGRDTIERNRIGYKRKWGQTFLLDWNIHKKFTVSLFETVMWPDQDSMRRKDVNYSMFSPIMFAHGSKSPSGISNNMMAGLNASYRVVKGTTIYAQAVADNLGSSGTWKSRYGLQLGVRSTDVLTPGLNLLAEFNTARPYMYATSSVNTNYSHLNQPLAHPLGANFREGIFIADYSYKRFWFRLELLVSKYGDDSTSLHNYGRDIFKNIATRSAEDDVKMLQGVKSDLLFGDFKAAYILNDKTNMRIEAGLTLRNDKNSLRTYKDRFFYIGLRSSFRNLFYDF
ncbi:hypothetical protein [Foetidibacter luteolus]|uniref:hypothetical protein n=1 Tax=Foetidibacter luteolus TaxID=2608880 RepID=UPI00129AF707|nr:hypothetical protein [Foetidibacter luteolus]